MIEYRSIADLSAVISRNLSRIPHDIDLIVGIPRSGLLAANILALYLNLPLTDVDGLVANRLLDSGHRAKTHPTLLDGGRKLKVLILDDSIDTGKQIQQVRKRLESTPIPHEILYGAIYGTPPGSQQLDFCFEVLSGMRVFEWNIMHSWVLEESCVDIDGVLCRDPSEAENDDGPRYVNFLKTAAPIILPTVPIGWLVTCRLEKYRQLTEQWLKSHGIAYRELVMMNFPSKAARIASGTYAKFKAEAFVKTDAELFIESSLKQSREIALRSGKQVFCFETGRMEYPPLLPTSPGALHSRSVQILRNTRATVSRALNIPRKVYRGLQKWKAKRR